MENIFTNDPHGHVERCGVAKFLWNLFLQQLQETRNSQKFSTF